MIRGVDGCVAGWLTISVDPTSDEPSSRICSNAASLFEGDWTITAIDIPIGLPAAGARECDVAARKLLGARHSSVFPAPLRCVLASKTYEDACASSKQVSGQKLSKQAFAIIPKIRDIDEYLRKNPDISTRVFEVHPEVCFTVWNRDTPMRYRKQSGFGFLERLRIIEQSFPGAAERVRTAHPSSEVSDDDILDALAALWTARRLHQSAARFIGPENARDEAGLPMKMWA